MRATEKILVVFYALIMMGYNINMIGNLIDHLGERERTFSHKLSRPNNIWSNIKFYPRRRKKLETTSSVRGNRTKLGLEEETLPG